MIFNSFEFIPINQSNSYYSKLRWLGDSVGFGIWVIFTEPENTIYDRTLSYIEMHQTGTGIDFDDLNFSVPG